MNKILILTCGVLMISSVVLGDDTTTETCANGAGTVQCVNLLNGIIFSQNRVGASSPTHVLCY